VADSETFVEDTEPFRRELLAHCYRMIGSLHDAEDLVQETYVRASRSYAKFEGRSSLRTWLYRIATNVCLTALTHHSRRVLPSGLGGPEPDPEAIPMLAGSDVAWLQPVPDAMVNPDSADPAVVVAGREDLRLALIASLQYLPGRQRAVLILRDVLDFPAAEVAVMLDTSAAAIKSTLQRARTRLQALALVADDVAEPTDPEARALLDRYIEAFENADATALQHLLCGDATLEATPVLTWFAGNDTCIPYLRLRVMGSPGDWRMLPTRANGQPAAIAYTRDPSGAYQAYGVVVLTVTARGISQIISFGDSALVVTFGYPTVLEAGQESLVNDIAVQARWQPTRVKHPGSDGDSRKPRRPVHVARSVVLPVVVTPINPEIRR
jgi:RNA polymerase sigma-70 factor, ECF subfamily